MPRLHQPLTQTRYLEMIVNKKKLATTAATFGAAIGSMYAAPELQANIVTLTFSPGSIGTGTQFAVVIDQLGSQVAFSQWNDSIGKTMSAGVNIVSLTQVAFGQTLFQGTFSGTVGIGFTASQTGTVYVGFRDTGGNVGWFSLNLGGAGGNIVYFTGEWGNAGEDVIVGGTPAIPEPSSVGLVALAAGAAGLRRRRKAA